MGKTVKVGPGIEIRALTWGEKRKLKEEGFDLSGLDPQVDNDALVERVIHLSTGRSVQDTLAVAEVYALFREIFRLSFVGEDEAKNSDGRPT